ncbi:MAG: hypothetical protein QOI12_2211 [Alphaproteobacteria bacterium]|jgi:hypothetical protein|nr:hypothetical protein [Alphaproteobacteria bacterium]
MQVAATPRLTAVNAASRTAFKLRRMDHHPIDPPLVVKDIPRPRRLSSLTEARDYVDEALRRGRPPPWRELWHRLQAVKTDDEAADAIGALRELLELEELLVPPTVPIIEPDRSRCSG